MDNVKLSIIVPVYNVEQYISKCIASLLVEGEDDYEIIIVNDGTKDRSIDVIKEFFSDPRIRYLEQPNGGLSAARNHGIAESRGEFIWCVDSDDWVETNEIPKMITLLDKTIDALYFGSYYSDSEFTGNTILAVIDNHAETGVELACSSFAHCAPYYLIRKELLDNNKLRFTEGILHEDSLFTPIMITLCNRVLRYNAPVYHHLQRDGSITHSVSPKRIYDMIYVIRELISYGESLPETIRWKWGRCIAQITNGVLLCSRNCEDREAKNHLKEFVNKNTSVLKYLAHSGVNNRIMAILATLIGGRLYQVYGILSKIRY
jgi:glycosyltransferase involved in cell wall biosynthesis